MRDFGTILVNQSEQLIRFYLLFLNSIRIKVTMTDSASVLLSPLQLQVQSVRSEKLQKQDLVHGVQTASTNDEEYDDG